MRRRAADRVECGGVDEQVEIGTHRPERVIAGCADLGTGLPPAVRAGRDLGIELIIEPGVGTHAARRGLDRHPVAIGNTARLRRCGMQLHLGMHGALA